MDGRDTQGLTYMRARPPGSPRLTALTRSRALRRSQRKEGGKKSPRANTCEIASAPPVLKDGPAAEGQQQGTARRARRAHRLLRRLTARASCRCLLAVPPA